MNCSACGKKIHEDSEGVHSCISCGMHKDEKLEQLSDECKSPKYVQIKNCNTCGSENIHVPGAKQCYFCDNPEDILSYEDAIKPPPKSIAELCSNTLDRIANEEDNSEPLRYVISIKPKGGATQYYDLPANAKTLQDLIEHRNMNGSVKDIFKACYRLGNKDGMSDIDDATKMAYYSLRELGRLTNSKDYISIAKEIIGEQSKKGGI